MAVRSLCKQKNDQFDLWYRLDVRQSDFCFIFSRNLCYQGGSSSSEPSTTLTSVRIFEFTENLGTYAENKEMNMAAAKALDWMYAPTTSCGTAARVGNRSGITTVVKTHVGC